MLYYINGKRKKALDAINSINYKNVYDCEEFYNCANIYGLLADAKDCIGLLKKAINHGFYNYRLLLNDSFLNPVRNSPKFKRVLVSAKKESDNFKNELIENSLLY